jgi:ABC-2 type transport system ATP-binding protein
MRAQPATTTVQFRLPATPIPESLRKAARIDGDTVALETDDPTRTLFELTSWAVQSGTMLDGLQVTRPSLEDVYLEITDEAEGAGAQK